MKNLKPSDQGVASYSLERDRPLRPSLDLPALGNPVPVVLAPLSGLTDAPFREAVEAFGVGWTVSEMVAGEALLQGKREARLRMTRSSGPQVVQLAGYEVAHLAEAARQAVGEGAAVIDINMGCPAKRVSGKLCGSGLMRDLDHASRLIEATLEAAQVPVSVKMRLGWDAMSLNAPELARRAEALGACLVSVHGRTRAQFYKGKADWAAIREVVQAVKIPVLANGDFSDLHDLEPMLSQSGAAGVMIGRGALGRPWLLRQVCAKMAGTSVMPDPSPLVQSASLLSQYEKSMALYQERYGVRHLRSHIDAALRSALHGQMPDQARRLAIMRAESAKEVMALIKAFFDDLAAFGAEALVAKSEAA